MAREAELSWPELDDVARAVRMFLDLVLSAELDATWSPTEWKWMA